MTTHAPGPADAFVSAPPIAPDGPRSPVPAARALMRAGLVGFALFAPFSIAGMSVTLGLVAAGAALDAVTRRDVALGALTGRRDPLVVAAALVVATAIPAVLLSENRDRAWHDARSMWQYAVPFVVAWAATRTGERRGVLHVLAGASMLAAVMALVQRAGGMDLGPLHIDAEHRVSGTLHPMTFAGIFAMLVPLSAALATAPGTTRRSRAFFAAAALLQWAALLLTLTRGAWLAAAAGLATLSALRRHRALVVGAALLGAAHCAGMCGPLVALFPGGRARLAWHAARIAAYALLGLLAGALGAALDLGGALAPRGEFRPGAFEALGALCLECAVVALVDFHATFIEVGDVRRDAVEEVAVV